MGCCKSNNSSLSQVKDNHENDKRTQVQQQQNSAFGEEKKANQINEEEENRKQLLQNQKFQQDFRKLLFEKKESQAENQKLKQELQKYKQIAQGNDRPQSSQREVKVKGKIDKIPIYFICTKTPKCKQLNENQVFIHSKCGTTSFFHANGTISCMNKTCAKYTIKNALFSCKANTVCQEEAHLNYDDFEQIQDLAYLADFIEDCLNKDNHKEQDQDNFRQRCGDALSLLIC